MERLLLRTRTLTATPDRSRSYSPDVVGYPKSVYPQPRLWAMETLSGRRSSHLSNELLDDTAARRLSEAGVNRRPSGQHVLTEDTDSFIVGNRVFVDGVNPGRIQYIGETKFGPGDWAGIVLEEPLGKNDGSVGKTRYFQCDPFYGVFARLYRLTLEPLEGAEQALEQMRKYGYEVADSNVERTRRGSSSDRRASMSPARAVTPEFRRSSLQRPSPDRRLSSPRRTSLGLPENRTANRRTPGRSPLASPQLVSRGVITGGRVHIDRDPEIGKLTEDARRLSMGPDRSSVSRDAKRDSNPRRSSELMSHQQQRRSIDRHSRSSTSPSGDCRIHGHRIRNVRGLNDQTTTAVGRESLSRKFSHESDKEELMGRRFSESGLRKSSVGEKVLNEDTDNLMVGLQVFVDGWMPGRIAYIGEAHFAKGDVAGIHLERPEGKNNGTVGGHLYFQCEPKHGIFARPNRLTLQPIIDSEE